MPNPLLKVTVMGAGAVGSYYGGMLARAGHAVTLVARPQHAEAIARDGLRMETLSFDERVQLAATSDPAGVAGADLVLFSVKSTDTEAAGAQIKPHLAPGALLLTLQNGVDNAERLRAVLPGVQVAAAVVYVASEMAGPGHLRHKGRGDLVIEPSPGSAAVAQALVAAGVPTKVSPDVRGELWAKLVLNCAFNAISAIAQLPYGKLAQGPGVPKMMADVVAECLAVAQAEGVVITIDMGTACRKLIEAMPGQYASTAQDLARHKHTEIDYLNGLIVRRGDAHGIPVPANNALWALVKLLEAKQA